MGTLAVPTWGGEVRDLCIPQLRGHLEGGGLQGPAGQAAPPGQDDSDGGPRRGAATPCPGPGLIPLLLRRPQLLEEPEALREVGVRPGNLGRGQGSTWGQREPGPLRSARVPVGRGGQGGRRGMGRGGGVEEGQDAGVPEGGGGGGRARAHPVSARGSREEQPPRGPGGRHGGRLRPFRRRPDAGVRCGGGAEAGGSAQRRD